MPRNLPRPRALQLLLLLAARALSAQAVLGPTEDATVAPVGVMRFRIANSWQHYDQGITGIDTAENAYVQIRYTPVSLEFGLLSHFSATAVLPGAGTLSVTTRSVDSSGIMVPDSLIKQSHNGLGDIALGAKYSWLPGPTEQERIALAPGLHLRSSLAASYRFATGETDLPSNPFDVGTGSGRAAVGAASQTDLMVGRGFWMSMVGHYEWPQPVTQLVQVWPPGMPLSNLYPPIQATESGGNTWSVEATPRVVLGRYFAVGAQYQYVHRDASSFVGSKDTVIAGNPVTIDAASLDSTTAGTAQYWSATFTYSAVAAYLQGKTGVPIEVSFTHAGTLSATGSFPRNAVTNIVTIRIWASLWSSTWKRSTPATK